MSEIRFHISKERVAAMTQGEKMVLEAANSGDAEDVTIADTVHLLARFVQVEQVTPATEGVVPGEGGQFVVGAPEQRAWVYPETKRALQIFKKLNDADLEQVAKDFVKAFTEYAVPPASGDKSS